MFPLTESSLCACRAAPEIVPTTSKFVSGLVVPIPTLPAVSMAIWLFVELAPRSSIWLEPPLKMKLFPEFMVPSPQVIVPLVPSIKDIVLLKSLVPSTSSW